MKPIPYGRQHITEEDIQAVVKTLKSDFLTQGPKVEEFENEFCKYIGCKYAVAVSSGTAALHLSAIAMDIQPGDKVITTPITFAATANCIKYCGGEVVFSDIDPQTFLLDLDKVRKLLEKSPKGTYKGIIPVDFAGRAIDLEVLRDLANEFGLWIIEDASHAPGGYFVDSSNEKQNCGNGVYADLAIFSFHPVKHIATGEGGMITTNDKLLYQKLRTLRTHGITKDQNLLIENHGNWYYEMQMLGFNYRISDIQCALGISQLKRAEEGINQRIEIARKYYDAFHDNTSILNQSQITNGHAFHLYIIEVEKRKDLYDYLRQLNIIAQVHYIPIHLLPYYKQFGWTNGDMPNAELYYQRCISIPIYPTLRTIDQKYIIKIIDDFLND